MTPDRPALVAACLALLLPLLSSVSPAHAADPALARSASDRPLVLTTFLPVHSLAASIAGQDAIKVENWLPAGIDPHDFQFSARDLRRLRDAQILLVGGLGLEGWDQSRLRRVSGNLALRLIEASQGIPSDKLMFTPSSGDRSVHGHDHPPGAPADHDHGPGPNPHFWLDPVLMQHAVTNILHTFSQLDPTRRDGYEARARSLSERLERLHTDFDAALADRRGTAFVTYHDAFPYLARRYGLNLAGVVEASAAEEPSARELATLYQRIRDRQVKVLFTDGEPPRLAKRMAADLGLRLASLETLETGTLGPEAYEAGMRRNLEVLRKALAPPAP